MTDCAVEPLLRGLRGGPGMRGRGRGWKELGFKSLPTPSSLRFRDSPARPRCGLRPLSPPAPAQFGFKPKPPALPAVPGPLLSGWTPPSSPRALFQTCATVTSPAGQ